MFSAKIYKRKAAKNKELVRTANSIISYIFEKLNFKNTRVISSNSCIEITSGSEHIKNDDDIVIELLIRKHIVINNDDFNDKVKLDQHISKIKHFCEQAKSIEELKYLPINMREK